MSGKLEGKVALMAGCSPNINAGIALGLAAEGARLVCADIRPEYADACARQIVTNGSEAIALTCDVSDEDQVQQTVDAARKTYGGIDVLVNGATIHFRKGIFAMSIAEFRKQLDVILGGAFLFTKHVAELMVQQGRGGSIISLVSTEGHQGNPGNVGYGTAKAGLLNFTRSVAMELAEHGIRVNTPTPTGTDPSEGMERAREWGVTWAQVAPAERVSGFLAGDAGIPLRRRPVSKDYAKAAVFLASDDSAMITGFDLRVDGGVLAKYWRWNPS